jgi:predicted ribosomally synthesized peptide with nif11-like leader
MAVTGGFTMSMEKLVERFNSDTAFAEKYAGLSSLDDVLKQAREEGYSVTEEEAKAYIASHPEELPEGSLSSVVAGGYVKPRTTGELESSHQRLRNRLSCRAII